jgi:hypothetical protein
MAKKQIRVRCTGTEADSHWYVDETNGTTEVTPLVKELKKYSELNEMLTLMGTPRTIAIEVEAAPPEAV